MITKKDGKIKEYIVKFEDGSTKTFDEGILITGSHVKQDDEKIGFGVRILSAMRSGHTEYYYKAVKVLQDELKEQLEEREKKLKEIQKVKAKAKAKVAEEIANDMYEKTKKKMEKKFGIKIDGTLEKILKEKTIELVNHKMNKDILEEIGIDFDDM